MSVINKMLRDLDRRADATGEPVAPQSSPVLMTKGTASVDNSRPAAGSGAAVSARWAWPFALLAGCLAAAAWWFARPADAPGHVARLPATSPPELAAPAAVPAAPALPAAPDRAGSAQASALPAAPVAEPTAPGPVQGAPRLPVSAPPAATMAAAPVARAALAPAPAASPAASDRSGARPAPHAQELARAPGSAEPVMAASSAVASRPGGQAGASMVPVQGPDAALEALAQAQRLWMAGSRDAAIDLLTEALAVLGRLYGADLAGAGTPVPLAMLRELVRMQLAQGQPELVLAVLRRYERVWAGQADLWALRANAAQRLGQHAESAQSYRMALRLRPGEPRWMLGAAVSLAAMGQTGPAAEMAEQAQALAPVSPEVLAYLRQLGVPLRER